MLKVHDPGVQTHLTILQGIISRLASNSANAKTWSITLAAAVLVLMIDRMSSRACVLALIPVLTLVFLDAYYLALERDFRKLHRVFVQDLHDGRADERQLFVITVPHGLRHKASTIGSALLSTSVWPFYLLLILAVVAVGCLANGTGVCPRAQ